MIKRDIKSILFTFSTVVVLIFSAIIDYEFYKDFVELIVVFLSLMIFIIAYYSKEYTKDSNLLYVGIAYLSLAFLDFMHLVNAGGLSNLQINLNAQGQLWIASRATEGFILYYAFSNSRWKRKFDFKFLFLSFSFSTFAIMSLVVLNEYMPKIYTAESGYNLYKYFLDFLVIAMFVVALITINKNEKRHYNKTLLTIAVSLKIIAEIIFIFETGEPGVLEVSRYIIKFVSYVLLFMVFVKELLQRPYDNIFMAFKKKEAELIKLTKIDSLTGLYNHSTSYEILKEMIENQEHINNNLCLFMVDLDDFKHINDKYGHVKGDEILRKIGTLFASCKDPVKLVGRYGGDEFIILLENCDCQEAKTVAKRIFGRIEELSKEVELKVTLSIGIATWRSGLSATELVKLADAQLYIAKDLGKNVFSIDS